MPADEPSSPEPTIEQFDRLWNYGKPEETAEKFVALLPEAEKRGDVDLHAQIVTQIARTHGLRRDFDTAHEKLDEVETLLAGNESSPSVAHVRLALERGRAFNSGGDSERSIPLFEQAHSLAEELLERDPVSEFHRVDAAHMLGIVCPADTALEWNERAIAMAEEASDPRARGWLGALYNNTGWTHHDAGRFEKALELFERGVVFREEKGQAAETRIAKWTVARTHRSMGRLEEALEGQRALAAEHEAAELPIDPFVLEELGECLWSLDRQEEARPYFRDAVPGLEALGWVEADRIAAVKLRGEGTS